jgi:hypothetical protein
MFRPLFRHHQVYLCVQKFGIQVHRQTPDDDPIGIETCRD